MYSLNLDYLFNRVYDLLLFIKYTWYFTILRNDVQLYLDAHENNEWDGLRDRGWFDDYLKAKDAVVPPADIQMPLWQRLLEKLGIKLRDTDGDGIPDIRDASPNDSYNLSKAELKERYQEDYSLGDHIRDIFGIGPKDSDADGVPDSYEVKHNLNKEDKDTDHDELFDGKELIVGTNPLNNDTDKDGILDGRDEAPLNNLITSIGPDSDGDGVSDKIEKNIGSNIHKKDTDDDGIPDGMDTFPLDPNNISQAASFELPKNTEGLHFSIQNPALSFFADILSLVTVFVVIALLYAFMRWCIVFFGALTHYEHFFEDSHHGHEGNHGKSHSNIHVIPHHEEKDNHSIIAGIPGLPIMEEGEEVFKAVTVPSAHDYEDHPKFAVIQGYLSSTSEALWRIGIMEADNLLLESLREKGYKGDGLGEMLKTASFKTIDLAWDAHKIRNRIAHEGSDFELTEREARRAFTLYESVFRELKIIK